MKKPDDIVEFEDCFTLGRTGDREWMGKCLGEWRCPNIDDLTFFAVRDDDEYINICALRDKTNWLTGWSNCGTEWCFDELDIPSLAARCGCPWW